MAKTLLPPTWNVPPPFRQRLGDAVGRQRLMQADGHLLLVLHRPPVADQVERVARFFWREPAGTWHGIEQGGRSMSLASHLNEFAETVDKLDRHTDQATKAQEFFDLLGALRPMERSSRNLHAVPQEAREAIPDDRELINHRDRAYEIERAAELAHADARNGLEFATARQAEVQAAASHRMAVSAHRLNLLVAFFFPLATVATVLGANVRHGWEDYPTTQPFFLMLGAGLAAGVLLSLYISARSRMS